MFGRRLVEKASRWAFIQSNPGTLQQAIAILVYRLLTKILNSPTESADVCNELDTYGLDENSVADIIMAHTLEPSTSGRKIVYIFYNESTASLDAMFIVNGTQ